MEKYWQERQAMQFDMDMLNGQVKQGNPQAGQTLQIAQGILKRRDVLHSKEQVCYEDIAKLEKMMEAYNRMEPTNPSRDSLKTDILERCSQAKAAMNTISVEKASIDQEYKALNISQAGGTQFNPHANGPYPYPYAPPPPVQQQLPLQGFPPQLNPTPAPAVQPVPSTPELPVNLDTVKIAQFLNIYYDRLRVANPVLAKELESIFKYLNAGKFLDPFDSLSIEMGLEPDETKYSKLSEKEKKALSKKNKEDATLDYKRKLERAGAAIINLDNQVLKFIENPQVVLCYIVEQV